MSDESSPTIDQIVKEVRIPNGWASAIGVIVGLLVGLVVALAIILAAAASDSTSGQQVVISPACKDCPPASEALATPIFGTVTTVIATTPAWRVSYLFVALGVALIVVGLGLSAAERFDLVRLIILTSKGIQIVDPAATQVVEMTSPNVAGALPVGFFTALAQAAKDLRIHTLTMLVGLAFAVTGAALAMQASDVPAVTGAAHTIQTEQAEPADGAMSDPAESGATTESTTTTSEG